MRCRVQEEAKALWGDDPRQYLIQTKRFVGDESGHLKELHTVRVGPPPKFEPIPGTEGTLEADLVLLAMGFLGPVRNGMLEQLGVKLDQRGNVAATGAALLGQVSTQPLCALRHLPVGVA